jgi:hypothetical protein
MALDIALVAWDRSALVVLYPINRSRYQTR